jgi:hypothetical protein
MEATQQEEAKLIDIKEDQIKSVLQGIRSALNKGLKSGAYDMEDNVWILNQNIAVIFDQYLKVRAEFDKSQKAIEQGMKQNNLVKKANEVKDV